MTSEGWREKMEGDNSEGKGGGRDGVKTTVSELEGGEGVGRGGEG
jgi:hypothetical protein